MSDAAPPIDRHAIRVALPAPLCALVRMRREVTVDGVVTQRSILDALEATHHCSATRCATQRPTLVRFLPATATSRSKTTTLRCRLRSRRAPLLVVAAIAGGNCVGRAAAEASQIVMSVVGADGNRSSSFCLAPTGASKSSIDDAVGRAGAAGAGAAGAGAAGAIVAAIEPATAGADAFGGGTDATVFSTASTLRSTTPGTTIVSIGVTPEGPDDI